MTAPSANTKKPAPKTLITNPRQVPVKLKLVFDDETYETHIEVRIGSVVSANVWAGGNVDANLDQHVIRKQVEWVANEACNYLGRVHGDYLNSSEIARTALECLEDIFRAADAARKKIGK